MVSLLAVPARSSWPAIDSLIFSERRPTGVAVVREQFFDQFSLRALREVARGGHPNPGRHAGLLDSGWPAKSSLDHLWQRNTTVGPRHAARRKPRLAMSRIDCWGQLLHRSSILVSAGQKRRGRRGAASGPGSRHLLEVGCFLRSATLMRPPGTPCSTGHAGPNIVAMSCLRRSIAAMMISMRGQFGGAR